MSSSHPAATIKFFNADCSDSGSESESPPLQESAPVKAIDSVGLDHPDSDYDGGEPADSIYDIPSSLPEFNLRPKDRTDSDSNLLIEDQPSPDDPLILDVSEDHFGLPEDLTRIRDINSEIERIKQAVFQLPDEDAAKGKLIEKLISLRLRKNELEGQTTLELEPSSFQLETKLMYGHKFCLKDSSQTSERYCEVCCNLVWGVIHSWYVCSYCSICCHDKCLNSLKRMCASKRVAENSSYVKAICPDKGLSSQHYKCYECQTPISYKNGGYEPRQCDFSGNYYCPSCHWNDEAIIPARVMCNWDFEPRPVSRASRQFLRLMYKKPVLTFKSSHSYLLKFVQELSEMRKLREEILMMKKYFISCQKALADKLLLQLGNRPHFVENCDTYSMQDLVELVHEKLLPAVIRVHANFSSHIKLDCPTCRGKGYYCEVCNVAEVIFPFDNICVSCPECFTVFHKYCFLKIDNICPKCERRKKREEENNRKAELLKQIEETNSY